MIQCKHIRSMGAWLKSQVAGVVLIAVVGAAMAGCRIQPPLNLAVNQDVVIAFGEVITNLEVIWNTDESWRESWWYGWDENDIRLWGEIAYPEPSNYEARFYYFGEGPATQWIDLQKQTVYAKRVQRRFDFGYHDMLVWSNIDSPTGTQALIVDESDADNIKATTSRSRLSYSLPPSRGTEVYNNPEIFYSGGLENIYISKNFEDYDYFDAELNAWVKQLGTDLYPIVYIYLVQVVVYNNNGRIVALTDNAALDNMASTVDVRSGHTGDIPVIVSYEMGFKKDLPAREGRHADIFGGKLTTFGLCDMEPWSKSRQALYRGSRADLDNHLAVCFHFSNDADSAYHFDVTRQLQRQAHGGVVTIEIDADTLGMPTTGVTPGGFNGWVEKVDSVEYVIPMLPPRRK